jgi:hypothetical protein
MMTHEEIRQRGLKALRDELGRAGLVRFITQLKKGSGNYAVERRTWVDSMSMDDLVKELKSKGKTKPKRKRSPVAK